MALKVVVYKFRHKQDNTWTVVFWEWDGSCMCTKKTRKGEVEYSHPEGYEPDLMDMQKLAEEKYGNNSKSA